MFKQFTQQFVIMPFMSARAAGAQLLVYVYRLDKIMISRVLLVERGESAANIYHFITSELNHRTFCDLREHRGPIIYCFVSFLWTILTHETDSSYQISLKSRSNPIHTNIIWGQTKFLGPDRGDILACPRGDILACPPGYSPADQAHLDSRRSVDVFGPFYCLQGVSRQLVKSHG